MDTEFWSRISTKSKIAVVCFALGKFQSIIAVVLVLVKHPLAIPAFVLYAGLILASIVLSLIDMKAIKRNEKNSVTKYQLLRQVENSLKEGRGFEEVAPLIAQLRELG